MGEEQPTPQGELAPRVGTFFIILGVFSFTLFMASEIAKKPEFDWLFIGIVLTGIGFFFRRRAAPPPPSGRFGGVRKFREGTKKRKEEKAKKKK